MSQAPQKGCAEWHVTLHGFVDGELASPQAAQFEDHLANCADCGAELERVRATRRIIAQDGVRWRPPEALRSQVLSLLSFEQAATSSGLGQDRRESAWRRALDLIRRWSFVPSLAALAAGAILFANVPSQTLVVRDQIIASHVRSMMADHLTDVLTSDQHTVKPWFNGRIDFSPPVSDLSRDGFPLVGGRVDYIGGRAVAALVYRHNRHVINLFSWPAASSAQTMAVVEGYNIRQWSDGGLVFWAISDVAPDDLVAFENAFRVAARM
jgi:anti-sigma factor RsiW